MIDVRQTKANELWLPILTVLVLFFSLCLLIIHQTFGFIQNRHDYLTDNHTESVGPSFIESFQKHQTVPPQQKIIASLSLEFKFIQT